MLIAILFILIYTAIGCFFVALGDKFKEFKCESTDEKLLQGIFWPLVLILFLFWSWCKFCIKISKKILKK